MELVRRDLATEHPGIRIVTSGKGPMALLIGGIGLGLLGAVSILVLIAGSLDASAAQGLTAGSICTTSGPIAGLTDEAAANARSVTAVATARGGEPLAVVSLMVGLAESGLRVLGNPSQNTGQISLQGIGYDHDSLGIFQQRPSWGSVQQRLDPVASTNLFDDRVLNLADWQSLDPWIVAQRVQISAYDGQPRSANHFSSVIGGNYKATYAQAITIAAQIMLDSRRTGCDATGGSGVGVVPAGALGAHGLPIGYSVPEDVSAAARTAITAALSVLGRPYVWDAAGPNEFDCSGLTMWSWSRAGVSLPHYTGTQAQSGTETTQAAIMPGDLVLIPGADGTLADPQHVGMFIGRGLVVEAPEAGDVVKVVTYSSFISGGLSGLRHIE